MSAEHFNEAFKSTTPPSPKAALPIVTFAEDVTLHFNGEDVHVFHVDPAHTDGDAIVHFPKANIIHTGDIFFQGMYPFIDVSSGGSLNGMITAVEKLLLVADEQTKIIPGHGKLGNKNDLRSYRDMLKSVRDHVVDLVRRGKTLDEVKAARPTKDFDDQWGKGFLSPDKFVEIAYQSLAKK
jgi:glyoxylase-like metal-dependent hydrolase (beta-lactamase superfamily II)